MIKGKELSVMWPNWEKKIKWDFFGERQAAEGDRTCLGPTMKYVLYSQLLQKNSSKLQNAMPFTL